MSRYFEAPALVQLRREVDAEHPGRDRTADGWIGDTSHAARPSDHNPDRSDGGIVRARDFDKDGLDSGRLVLVALADPRTKYVIFNGLIWQRRSRHGGFYVSIYRGVNAHRGHVHVSVYADTARDSSPWGYSAPTPTTPPAAKPVAPPEEVPDMGALFRNKTTGATFYVIGGRGVRVLGDDLAAYTAAKVPLINLTPAGYSLNEQRYLV